MTLGEMLGQSGNVPVLIIGAVLLILMIFCVSAIKKIAQAVENIQQNLDRISQAIGLDKGTEAAQPGSAVRFQEGGVDTRAVTAAITAAVSEYRKYNS